MTRSNDQALARRATLKIPQSRDELAALLQGAGAVDLRGLHRDYSRLRPGVYFERRRDRIDVFAIPGDPQWPWIRPPPSSWMTTVSLRLRERAPGTDVALSVRRHLRPESRRALVVLVSISCAFLGVAIVSGEGVAYASFVLFCMLVLCLVPFVGSREPSSRALDLVSPLLYRLASRRGELDDPYRGD